MRLKFDVVRVLAIAAALIWPGLHRLRGALAGILDDRHGFGGRDLLCLWRGTARLLTHQLDLPVVMRPTEGPSQNILSSRLERSRSALSRKACPACLEQWRRCDRRTPSAGHACDVPMYDTPFQFVALQNTGIQSLADLGGSASASDRREAPVRYMHRGCFGTWAIDAQLVHGDWNDLAAQLIEGRIDALAVAAGVPFPQWPYRAQQRVQYIPVAQNQILRRVSDTELGPRLLPPAAIHRCASTTRPWGFSISPWSEATCPTIWSTLSSKRFSRTTA